MRVGDIGDVELKDGRAVVEMVIDPEYKGMIRTDASALLRPKTGLKDMFIDLEPGSDEAPAAGEGYTVPVQRPRRTSTRTRSSPSSTPTRATT